MYYAMMSAQKKKEMMRHEVGRRKRGKLEQKPARPRPVGSQARVQEEQQQSEVSEHYTTILHLIK